MTLDQKLAAEYAEAARERISRQSLQSRYSRVQTASITQLEQLLAK